MKGEWVDGDEPAGFLRIQHGHPARIISVMLDYIALDLLLRI
jgi:hypothetical protein